MTDISKDAVDALLQGVTDGPWREFMGDICANYDEKVIAGIGKSTGARSSEYFSVRTNRPEGGANARFIAAARELVPALRAALDEAEARARYAETDAGYLRTQSEELRAYWNQAEARATHWQAGWQRAMGEFDAKCKEANEQRARAVKAEAERDAANALLRDGLMTVQTGRNEPLVIWSETVATHLGAKP